MDEVGHLILVLLRKANLEHKEIYSSDCLKPPIYVSLTHILFGFLCFIYIDFRFGFALQEAYLQFKCM